MAFSAHVASTGIALTVSKQLPYRATSRDSRENARGSRSEHLNTDWSGYASTSPTHSLPRHIRVVASTPLHFTDDSGLDSCLVPIMTSSAAGADYLLALLYNPRLLLEIPPAYIITALLGLLTAGLCFVRPSLPAPV
jgi:hypothetical protein